ncbi:conserved hypothetical protein [Perkinsus marinus ATCC 50983]|uniref:XPG N-terminal domain-containing protein n=1 Tax=Perkinsus marinus (strain ATCC 50983 / TXsc) TaxID=423536 RepID=C5KTU8_PERM5|nr:conserved hypothetical protein [Perkinsus marinus ATCC 50983]EER11990.1 conserved hypothetical protein [Perkinsus marinus ATCC 50983]|eukprot:XP_002780195.1 conserved hypothetical protein [Perkinsus marinus ATCC 50983]
MRVRQLQTTLQDQGMIQQISMDQLSDMKMALDATFWLRSIQMLKDPYADALGGMPPGLFGIIAKELELFSHYKIKPIFVFDGIVPPLQHQMFQQSSQQQLDQAWTLSANGRDSEAQKAFAVATSRINSDICHFAFHFLKSKGFEVIRAPYFASAQLAYMAANNLCQVVYGPPGLLLYGVKSVLLQMDFQKNKAEWVSLDHVLSKWYINREQFIDACLLAGTEYCLTYPYLNLDQFRGENQLPAAAHHAGAFSFETAIEFIRQVPLNSWMQTFPTDDMRNDHVEGYCVCKLLLCYTPVLNTIDLEVRPLSCGDMSTVFGDRLPVTVYELLMMGFISSRLPLVLATGVWCDRQSPLIDSKEYRSLLIDLTNEYRTKALGIMADKLNPALRDRPVICTAYWEDPNLRRIRIPHLKRLKWMFTKAELEAEMRRQGAKTVDLRFCLQWHANEFQHDGPLVTKLRNSTAAGPRAQPKDLNSLSALVHFQLLESLEYFSEDGGMTVLGDVLKDTPSRFQEPTLFALELMKFGVLTGDPFEPVDGSSFPAAVGYPKIDTVSDKQKSITLLSRVVSLVPMKLKNDLWDTTVEFDLAAFHSLLRLFKRTLRVLCESCLADDLIENKSLIKILPNNTFSPNGPLPSDLNANGERLPYHREHRVAEVGPSPVLPVFMLPRTCMGIVMKYFMEWEAPQTRKPMSGAEKRATFDENLRKKFACCVDPMKDLGVALEFWAEVKRCIVDISDQLGAEEMKQDVVKADILLSEKRVMMNI